MGRASSRAVSRWSRSLGCCGFRGVFWMRWNFVFFFVLFFFERTRPAASMTPPCLIYLSTSTDCEGCTRLICTNPGSMGASEYGLTRGTCFVARHLEVVAVAGLLWTSWHQVCFGCGVIYFVFFLFRYFFFERTRPAASMRPPCFIYLYY